VANVADTPSAPKRGEAKQAAQADYMAMVAKYRWVILLGLITAAIMEILDTTIVNVALPTMAGNLGATFQEISWVSTGYILSNVIVLPMTAFFAARFGRRNYLTASILIFICASFMCGTSHTLVELVGWRIMQGAGGAALLSTAQATLRQIFPPEEQGIVQAVFLMGVIVAPTLGPTLGGWITDNYTWNWCFFINVPIGIASIFLVTTFLHDPPGMRQPKAQVDWWGIGLLAAGLGALQYVLEEGQRNDWFEDPMITRLSIFSAICLAIMVWWELTPKNPHPVVNFRVLHNRSLAAAIFLFVALGFGLYGGVYIFPLFTQSILHFSPTQTGLALLPGGLATACSALICGRILNGPKPLVDPRILIFIGVAIFAVSMYQLGHLTTQSGEPDTHTALIIRGFGLGFLFTPINQVAYASLKPQEAQQASGLINLSRQLGGSFGIAILATFVNNHTQAHRANLVTYINAGNPAAVQRLHAFEGAFQSHGFSADSAHRAAIAAMDNTVMNQAQTMSYNDAFILTLTVFLAVTPAIFLLGRAKSSAAVVDAH
jgi:MFS transporter, DHA2 family, multidrug resistance protein